MASSADIEKPISLVRPANGKAVRAILARAHKQEMSADKALARNTKAALRPVRSKGVLSKALGQALAHHGRTKKGATSLRPKAPDTNGRAFHFSHSTVGKGKAGGRGAAPSAPTGAEPGGGSDDAGLGPGSGSGSGTPGKGAGSTSGGESSGMPDLGSREAGHQRYVERDAALARDAVEVFGIPVGQGQEKGAARGGVGEEQAEGWERDPTAERTQSQTKKARSVEIDVETLKKDIEQASRGQRTQSAQEYIEDPSKVVPQTRHGHSNSFGTIGETFDERVAFWNDVTKHEREKDARTQIRLVLELPHEASPAARQEIVKKFCQQYEDLDVPYWASIHAPTKKNDHRNHHAHIVHGIRPTKRMIDPSTGKLAWDFTITEEYRTSSRNKKYKHPYRQNAVKAFWDRDYVRDTRKRLADVTNEVLTAHEYDIRYDPRSYKDMGLDIEPMKHVSRVVADKAKVRDFVVLDAAWTRRLIDQEMNAAAVERDKTYMELKAVEKQLSTLSSDIRKLKDVNAKLPASMKVTPASRLSVAKAKELSKQMLEVEHAKIAQRFADEATARTIQHIIDSTAPVSAHRGGKARRVQPTQNGATAPNPEALKLLHDAAKEEMRLHRVATAGRARKLAYLAMGVLGRWQEQAQPKSPFTAAPAQTAPRPKKTKPGPGLGARPFTMTGAAPQTQAASKTKAASRAQGFKPNAGISGTKPRTQGPVTPTTGFEAAEALRRQTQVQQARPTEQVRSLTPRPVYQTGAETVLGTLERTSTTGQKFPKFMHNYLNQQTAGVAAAVAAARAVGPEAVTSMWDAIKQRLGAGTAKAATEAQQAAPTPTPPPAREPRPMANPPPVIYVQPTPQADRREAPVNRGAGSATSRTATSRSQPRAGTGPGRPDAATEDRGNSGTSAGMRRVLRETRASAQTRQGSLDIAAGPTTAAQTAPRTPQLGPAQQPAPGSTAGVRTPEPASQARASAAPDPTRPTPAPPATDRASVAPAAQASPQPTPRAAPRPQRAAAPMPELEDLDLEALMRGCYTDVPMAKPKQGKVLKPSDFQRDRKPLTKVGSRPISPMELGLAPPRKDDPECDVARMNAQDNAKAEAIVEALGMASEELEEKEKIKRKKTRRKIMIVNRPGIER